MKAKKSKVNAFTCSAKLHNEMQLQQERGESLERAFEYIRLGNLINN
jgi:hypothetical protein